MKFTNRYATKGQHASAACGCRVCQGSDCRCGCAAPAQTGHCSCGPGCACGPACPCGKAAPATATGA